MTLPNPAYEKGMMDSLFYTAIDMTADFHLSEDVVQDVYLKAIQKQDDFNADKASLKTWLHWMLKTRIYDLTKHRTDGGLENVKPESIDGFDKAVEPPEPASDTNHLGEKLQTLVDGFAERYKLMYAMLLDGVPPAEMAIRLGISDGALRHSLHTLRQMLRPTAEAITGREL